MRSTMRENALAASGAAAALCAIAWLGVHGWSFPDWQTEARPAVGALMAGHISQFLRLAPIYGGSLLLRAPFIVPTKLWGGGDLSIYVAGALPCLFAVGTLGVWLSARMRALGRSRGARTLALALCVANPLMLPALQLGHPEDLLGAVLCIAAVLCAMDDRPIWAAVLLGLAIPNKEWAVLAVGPVLVALQHGRLRALLITGAIATLLLAPFVLVPHLLASASGSATVASTAATGLSTGAIFQPWQIWWFFGSHGHAVGALGGHLTAGFRTPPGWIDRFSHPLIVAVTVPLTALYAGLRRRSPYQVPNAPLLFLTLLFALRCVLDTWDTAYYALPFLLALLVWEALSFDRVPVRSLTGALAVWIIFDRASSLSLYVTPDMAALIFALVSVPSVLALTLSLYAPGLARRLVPGTLRGAVTTPAGWTYPTTQKAGVGT